MTAAPLRLLLRALVAAQRPLPEPARAAVAQAAALRLSPDDAEDERAIDALRAHLAATSARVEVVDYGAGTAGDNAPVRRVADVYRRASSGPLWGRVMTGLVRGLRPMCVLELGTNLGVSAAHIAGALRQTTGAPARRRTWRASSRRRSGSGGRSFPRASGGARRGGCAGRTRCGGSPRRRGGA